MEITVVIPTYNSMFFIDWTVNSILASKGVDIELILVDDLSTDGTWEYIQKWKDKAILIQNNRNYGGPNHGYNVGMAMATNKWICVTDHDDTVDEWKFCKQINMLERYGVDICTTDWINVFPDKGYYIKCNPMDKEQFTSNETFKTLLSLDAKGQQVFLNTLVFKKSLNVEFEETLGCLDYRAILEMFHNRTSCNVDEALLRRYVHGGNLSLNYKFKSGNFKAIGDAQEYYKMLYPSQCKQGRKRWYSRLGRYNYVKNLSCGRELLKSEFTVKNIILFVTCWFWPIRKFIIENYNIYIG